MYYISEKNREGEPESKKSSSSRSIAAVLEKKLEDKGNFKLRELELREKELEVRKTEAENEKKRIEIMETMMKQIKGWHTCEKHVYEACLVKDDEGIQ